MSMPKYHVFILLLFILKWLWLKPIHHFLMNLIFLFFHANKMLTAPSKKFIDTLFNLSSDLNIANKWYWCTVENHMLMHRQKETFTALQRSFCNNPYRNVTYNKHCRVKAVLKQETVQHWKFQTFIYLFSKASVRVFLDTYDIYFITNVHNSIIFLLCSWHIVLEHLMSIFQFLNNFTKELSHISGIQNKNIVVCNSLICKQDNRVIWHCTLLKKGLLKLQPWL